MPIKKSMTLDKKSGGVQEEQLDVKLEALRAAIENVDTAQSRATAAMRELREGQQAMDTQLFDLYYLGLEAAQNAAGDDEDDSDL